MQRFTPLRPNYDAKLVTFNNEVTNMTDKKKLLIEIKMLEAIIVSLTKKVHEKIKEYNNQ